MKLLRLSTGLVAAMGALIVVLPFQPLLQRGSGGFTAEITASSHQAGHIQLYADTGGGFSETDSAQVPLLGGDRPAVYRLPLPQGDYRHFRLDPIDRDGTVLVEAVRIVDGSGRPVRELPLGQFRGNDEIQSVKAVAGGIEVVVVPGKSDPQLQLTLDRPVSLHLSASTAAWAWLRSGAAVFSVFMLLCAGLDRSPALRAGCGRLRGTLRARPRTAIAWAALAGVVLSSWPIIFSGKSYVSPNYGAWLLYDQFPTLPGYSASETRDVRGSDIGAIMWQQVPYSAVQHRSLLRNFELPLWNRDNACGTPLLGQGQSMLGDPLHGLVIAANGAAWAWDLKFLVARWLLALGTGLGVWLVCRHRGAAMLVAAAMPFCGFFLYRINHPAVFSFCYAPWILYFWLRVVGSVNWRGTAAAAAGLLLANWSELNSGTVKEAYALLLTFNVTGGVVLLLSPAPWRWRRAQFAAMAGAGVLFAGLTCPIWYTFWDALRIGGLASDGAAAWQIQPSLLIGLFDEALFRPINRDFSLFNPSANFLILAGVLYFCATLREQARNRMALGLAVGAVLPLALVFGLVPPGWIEACPFVQNIHHIDDCFGSALILLAAILAGAGFALAERRLRTAAGPGDLGICAVLLGTMLWGYFGFGHAAHRALLGEFTPVVSVWKSGSAIAYGPFVPLYLASLLAALALGGWLTRVALTTSSPSPATAIGLGVCTLALVWRGAEFGRAAAWPDFVLQPPGRVDFRARSPVEKSVEQSARHAPIRSIGLQGNFFSGWTAFYGLECINGPDAISNPFYRQLTAASPLQRVWDWRLNLTRENLAASRPFLDLLNVKHYLDLHSDQAALGAVLKLDQLSDLDLYESRTAWPRAFFVDRIAEYGSPSELMALIAADGDRPFAALQKGEVAAGSPLTALLGKPGPGISTPATAYHLTENSTAFAIHAPTDGFVVLTETFWSGYPHVSVDGRTACAIRANHAFIGIPVPAGEHRIEVRYRPRNFDLNLLIAGVSGLLLIGGYCAARRSPLPSACTDSRS